MDNILLLKEAMDSEACMLNVADDEMKPRDLLLDTEWRLYVAGAPFMCHIFYV